MEAQKIRLVAQLPTDMGAEKRPENEYKRLDSALIQTT